MIKCSSCWPGHVHKGAGRAGLWERGRFHQQGQEILTVQDSPWPRKSKHNEKNGKTNWRVRVTLPKGKLCWQINACLLKQNLLFMRNERRKCRLLMLNYFIMVLKWEGKKGSWIKLAPQHIGTSYLWLHGGWKFWRRFLISKPWGCGAASICG